MRYKLFKYEWNEETKSTVIGRQWHIQADRIEVEGHSLLRAFEVTQERDELIYVSRDWDEVMRDGPDE